MEILAGKDSEEFFTSLLSNCSNPYTEVDPVKSFLLDFDLSSNSLHSNITLRLARTIADLSGEEALRREHLLEALSYRALDNLLTQLRDL